MRQWLGVVVGIAIALLLTLPLPLPYCVPSCCRHNVQLHFASCNVARCATALVAALRVVPWHFYAMQRDAVAMLLGPRRCVLFCGIARRATAWFFVLRPCASCRSQHFCATALCFVPRRFAGVEAFCFVLRHCASCRSIGSGVARRVTAPAPLSFIEKRKTINRWRWWKNGWVPTPRVQRVLKTLGCICIL